MITLILVVLGIIFALFFFGFFEDLFGTPEVSSVEKELPNDLLGKEGVVDVELRPSGRVTVEGKSHPAVSELGFISKGEAVTVLRQEGVGLTVRAKHKMD